MYRIAVIQNEVEMQHSGYVDAVYKSREEDWKNKKDYKLYRFSSVNISQLFRIGENYLLDFDCLIIGTNATSDDDVYKVLREQENKKLLADYISKGKGLLVCSQKKLKEVERKDDDEPKKVETFRHTAFLPSEYEYMVCSRPKEHKDSLGNIVPEDSSIGKITFYKAGGDNQLNAIQEIIRTYPTVITDDMVEKHCIENGFQKHFYRDYIKPNNDSDYLPILVDNITEESNSRNLLMVYLPRKKERIVISTMALDWAGHFELLENIMNYLLLGIPPVAIIKKQGNNNSEFNALIEEVKLNNLSHTEYQSLSELKKNKLKLYHSVYVFSSDYTEKEVLDYWDELGLKKKEVGNNRFKFLYFKKIGSTFVLEYLSSFGYFDSQKDAVCTWLKNRYNEGFWDGSFWKTHDVLFTLHNIQEPITPYLKDVFEKIYCKHDKDGSYDGVLAPTCGLLELQSLLNKVPDYRKEVPDIEEKFKKTKDWLIKKFVSLLKIDNFDYKNASDYNKKFIIRSFDSIGCYNELQEVEGFSSDYINSLISQSVDSDNSEIDLCLDIEVCLIYFREKYNNRINNIEFQKISKRIEKLLNRQSNGKWDDNLGKTARITVFLQELKEKIDRLSLSTDDDEKEKEIKNERISNAISEGIIALKRSYRKNNWENNVVTTAKAITALKNGTDDSFALQDSVRLITQETTTIESNDSLKLCLATIDRLNKAYGDEKEQKNQISSEYKAAKDEIGSLKTEKSELENELSEKKKTMNFKFAVQWSIIVFLAFMFVCLVFYYQSECNGTIKNYIYKTLLFSPVVIGVLVTTLIKKPMEFAQYIKDLFKGKKQS